MYRYQYFLPYSKYGCHLNIKSMLHLNGNLYKHHIWKNEGLCGAISIIGHLTCRASSEEVLQQLQCVIYSSVSLVMHNVNTKLRCCRSCQRTKECGSFSSINGGHDAPLLTPQKDPAANEMYYDE